LHTIIHYLQKDSGDGEATYGVSSNSSYNIGRGQLYHFVSCKMLTQKVGSRIWKKLSLPGAFHSHYFKTQYSHSYVMMKW